MIFGAASPASFLNILLDVRKSTTLSNTLHNAFHAEVVEIRSVADETVAFALPRREVTTVAAFSFAVKTRAFAPFLTAVALVDAAVFTAFATFEAVSRRGLAFVATVFFRAVAFSPTNDAAF